MSDHSAPANPAPAPNAAANHPRILPLAYAAAFATSYFLGFVWFHLKDQYGTQPGWNLMINAGFGFFYVLGCAAVMRLTKIMSPRAMLLWAYGMMVVLSLAGLLTGSRWEVAAIIFGFSIILTATWPNLEALAAVGREGEDLGRAVSHYNIAWAGMSAVSYPIAGKLYDLHPATLFVVPAVVYVLAIALTLRRVPAAGLRLAEHGHAPPKAAAPAIDPAFVNSMKNLSLVGNLGCYLLIQTLMPILPFVTLDLGLENAWQATLFGSLWMAGRVSAFVILGRWHGWHFRRGMFFAGMFALPVFFALITLSGSLTIAAPAQYLLGLGLGFIYTSSLFYSLQGEFSAGDATIHEAALGMGMMLGPLLSGGVAILGGRWEINPIFATTAINVFMLIVIVGLMLLRARKVKAPKLAAADSLPALAGE